MVLCETPTVVAGYALTTGQIKRNSIERILRNTFVQRGIKDGLGCDATHYSAAELEGKIIPDEHVTCFHLKGKGLVVISSCGHVGIVNSVRQAQAVSGIEKVHAIVGGFHLGPAPKEYLTHVVAEMKALKPDVVIPMHCKSRDAGRLHTPKHLILRCWGSEGYMDQSLPFTPPPRPPATIP